MDSFFKQPSESFVISIDFSNVLGTTTIASYTVVAYNGQSIVTNTVIDTHAQSGNLILIKVKDGSHYNEYKITVVVTTSNSEIFEKDVMMKVNEE